MGTFRDLTKEPPFGRLTVVERGPNTAQNTIQWWCQCKCGAIKLVRTGDLTSGSTQSCGCLLRENARQRHTTHGLRHTPEYSVWHSMKRRCFDPTNKRYAQYGGRGITVCERWLQSFEHFYADMGPRPSPKHSLDRYPDPNGPYSPENCRWGTLLEQAQNKSNNRLITLDGHTACVAEWCRIKGMPPKTFYKRVREGLSEEEALTKPLRHW